MIVVDAGVLIAHFDRTEVHHERATRLLLATGDEPLRMGALTMAEVLVGPCKTGTEDTVRRAMDQLGLQVVGLSSSQVAALAGLRATTGLPMPDCCSLLTAETYGAKLATFDDRLMRIAAVRAVHVLS
ncbi:hypothetical protein GCM10010171_14780 [Actinokineospora fastidiosa]|uniref:Ribonuclease VapC n=1 Tax=Actinokineospora fastidiosa TaxID=1816 RepID=A0A918L9J1_9PSEU|nr:putative nucleic acid-binding protein, contains PIN domain [Actinokineospora sp. UTMC 2448]GGS22939.1 hypothetical protein GCM10010171_14780 [Actinokineospora fastidiosa]